MPTIGQETAQSGPHVPTEAAPVAVISCCGSFVHRMREWGYTPLAAPILDFSSLRGTPVTPSDACRSLPRSFSIFVAPDRPVPRSPSFSSDCGRFERVRMDWRRRSASERANFVLIFGGRSGR